MTPEEIAAMKAENDRLKAELEKSKTPPKKDEPPPPPKKADAGDDDEEDGDDDGDLREKAKRARDAGAKKESETKVIEAALTFNIGIPTFLKENADVLPSTLADLVKQADKETYDSKVERANVIKAAWVQEFFSVQENVDLLTTSQKARLADYLKLTVTAKEEKAGGVYEDLFEPALETLKKVKKAEELGKARAGLATDSTGAQSNFIKKMTTLSKEFYLREKETV